MVSTSKRLPDIQDRGERRGICSHCGWYEGVSSVKADEAPVGNGTGDASANAKYRIIM